MTTLSFETKKPWPQLCLHFRYSWRDRGGGGGGRKGTPAGPPVLSAAPQGSTVPGRHPSEPERFQQRPLSFRNICSFPLLLRSPTLTFSSLYHSGATPSRDLTSQSSFLLLLASSQEPASCFWGEVPKGREAAMQQPGDDISANRSPGTAERGSPGSQTAETPPIRSKWERICGLADANPDTRGSAGKSFCGRLRTTPI